MQNSSFSTSILFISSVLTFNLDCILILNLVQLQIKIEIWILFDDHMFGLLISSMGPLGTNQTTFHKESILHAVYVQICHIVQTSVEHTKKTFLYSNVFALFELFILSVKLKGIKIYTYMLGVVQTHRRTFIFCGELYYLQYVLHQD